jgi:hypothetical protein
VVVTWTLVIYLVLGGPSITIEGFTKEGDCQLLGQMYQEMIDERAQFKCTEVAVRRDVPPHRQDR